MKKLFSLMAMAMLVVSVMPMIIGTDTGMGIGIDIGTEDFSPKIWMCDSRVVIDDDLEPGRVNGDSVTSAKFELCESLEGSCVTTCTQNAEYIFNLLCEGFNPSDPGCPEICQLEPPEWNVTTIGLICETVCEQTLYKEPCEILKGYELIERHNNYAFEGEKIEWIVLVMDKNKIEEVSDVMATVDDYGEVECVELHGFAMPGETLMPECNARIGEEQLDQFDDQTMAYYECTLTVEPSMYGEAWVTVQATSSNPDEDTAVMDENEYWFLNPVIAVSVDNEDISFEGDDTDGVRPGTIAYSDTILVGNDADVSSGVMLDMFITGTDFYDPDNSGARCVITNRLKLGDNHAKSSNNYLTCPGDYEPENVCNIGFGDTDDHICYYATSGAYSTQDDPRSDIEGYAPIVYGDYFSPDLYNDAEMIQDGQMGAYWMGNILSPGSEMAVTFKLGLPEPCTGDFSDGSIYFWGEAI